ncbi:MAG: hypothetical protein JW820_12045 [Spirochaetales bacterium]|nr:hypothetical protein [Spirochaetales bacterium]
MKPWYALLPLTLGLLAVSCLGNLGRARPAEDPFRGRGPLVFPEDLQGREVPAEQAFRVVEYAPAGAASAAAAVPWENLEGGLWVLFNEPVVPLGQTAPTAPVAAISPPVEGTWRWYGSRLLAFEPGGSSEAGGSLEPATQYLVSLDPGLRSLSGQTLSGMNAFHFRTPALELVSLSPSGEDVPPEECRELRVTFNFPVELETILPSLRLEASAVPAGQRIPGGTSAGEAPSREGRMPRGRRVASRAVYDPELAGDDLLARRVLVLTPRRELPWDSRVTLRLQAGARPAPGTYGTETEQSLGFTTLRPFALVRGEVYTWLPSAGAGLVFNHPLEAERAASFIEVDLPGYDLHGNLEVYGAVAELTNLPVPFESSFGVRVRAGLQDLYGQRLAEDLEIELEVGPAPAYARLRAEGDRLLEAGFPPTVAVEFQNVLEGGYSAGPLAHPFLPVPEGRFEPYPVDSLPRNTRLFRLLDLSPYLNEEGRGSAYARWRFRVPDPWSEEPYTLSGELRLQVTDIGLGAHLAPNRITVDVASLATGAPIPGAEVLLRDSQGEWKRGRSDAGGLCSFDFEPGELSRRLAGQEESLEIEVQHGRDRLVFRPADSPSRNWNYHGLLRAETPRPATYLVSDRGIYRPGETLAYFGIDRDVAGGRLQVREGPYQVRLQRGWYGDAVVAQAAGRLSPSGRFWGQFVLPEELEPDEYLLVYSRSGEEHREMVPVRIAMFRRVGFAVDLDLPGGERYMGERLEARFSGSYLAGGEVARGRWSYWWMRRPVPYAPPDPEGAYRGFRFGDFPVPGAYDEDYGYYAEDLSAAEGALAGSGVVPAVQELADGRPGRVYRYELTATIEDLDRQAVSRNAGVSVFTSSLLIGARLAAGPGAEQPLYFVEAGKPFTLQACWVRPDGSPYGGGEAAGQAPPPLSVRLLREEWKMVRERSIGGRIDTRWLREEIEEGRFVLEAAPGGDARGRVLATREVRAAQVGSYILELRGADREGREALTRVDFYSTGSANVLWRRGDERRIDLVADRPSYAPGERARLLIKSPLEGGTYLLTVEREGILEERLLRLDGTTETVDVEIREEHVPVLYVSLSSHTGRTASPPGSPDEPDLGKPRGVFGMISLRVEAETRRIELELESSRASYRPGSEARLRVRATRGGLPLQGAEVLVVAADRGVLDLIDYHLADPLELFYAPYRFAHGVSHYDSRDLLIDPVVWKPEDLPGGDKEGQEPGGGPVGVRRDFRATALFEPGLRTDARGEATVRFRLPDQLTRFRVTAVAVDGEHVGLAEEELVVQNPLNVRPALPRSLRVGDRARAGVVVTNLEPGPQGVRVRLESELLAAGAESELTATLAPGESRELAFPLEATRAGPAFLRFRVDSEVLREALETQVPVKAGSVSETFTVIGQTDGSAQEALALPEGFLGVPGEGLTVRLDSTLASSLTEAIAFLDLYPYDCLEQRTSKLLARVLYDWLPEEPRREGEGVAARGIQEELAVLEAYQNDDGGMSFWPDPGFRRSGYYVSLRAAHLLHLAAEAGYDADAVLDREALVRYLEERYEKQGRYLQAYALYVLALHGRRVSAQAGLLLQHPDLGLAERALLALSYLAAGERAGAERLLTELRNHYRVGTRSVILVEPQASWTYYGGDLQAKALLLMLYSRLDPDSQIRQALADDLLASARRGYWVNTSNTGWVLQGFAEAIRAGGDRAAEFAAEVRLGESVLVRERFSGMSAAPVETRIGPELLEEIAASAAEGGVSGALPLGLSKEGRGRLYYALSLRYALAAERVAAREEGIGLFTEVLDPQGRPAGEPLELGQVYTLHGVVYSNRDRDFLALRVPLPAGAEALDGSLATTQSLPPRGVEDDGQDGYAAGPWYDRPVQRVYDDEVRLFYDRFPRGKREFTFLFRTTTPGVYTLPPATAELMYEPEVFGRTAGGEVRIEP